MNNVEQGFQTQNVAIATMLFTLNVPWWKNDLGETIPCFVFYDIDILGKIAAKELPQLKGMDAIEGTKLAHQRGKKGIVKYNFVRDSTCDRLLTAWGKHEKWMNDSPGAGKPNMEFPDIEPESAARLFCQWSKNRTQIANLWKGAVPQFVQFGKNQVSKEPVSGPKGESGERTITEGSFKAIGVNASAETRKRIGL